jgi:Rad3-related DNA helicase
MDEQLIHAAFPHRDGSNNPTYRDNQFELIRDALEAFKDDAVEDVVVEAPTGAGKTSIAVTVARVMTIGFDELLPRARQVGHDDVIAGMEIVAPRQAHLITSMKMLQDAYLGDDPLIKLVKGKGNYECHRNPRQGALAAMSAAVNGRNQDFSCDEAEQMFGSACKKDCPYKLARDKARWAPIALHNFDSFLHQVTLGGAFIPRRLLTVDEAHNGEEKLRNFMTLELNERMFSIVDLPWVLPKSEDIDTVTEWVRGMLAGVDGRRQELSTKLQNLRKSPRLGLREIESMSKLVKATRIVEGIQTKLDRFYKSRKPATDINPASWVATIAPTGSVTLEPVDAGRFVPAALLRYGDKRLHMSATFLNGRGGYTRAVNLRAAKAKFLSAPSTFPVASRHINMRPSGRLGAKDWNANFPKAVENVRKIMDENPGVRGVIHCTSYTMASQFAEALKDSKRIVWYEKKTRDSIVNRFMSGWEYPDGVLLAVALTEGYDFKNDLCRFQTIVRVPYPVPGKCMKARMEKDGRFYGWRTSLTLVQTYGRGMRSKTDHCKTYVLDSRFTDFVKREKDQLPYWFLEAIQ